MSADKPRRLGRGLEALIASATAPAAPASVAERSELQTIPIGQIRPNPFQPRKEFRPDELADLEASIKASGLIQPITVRPAGDGYELIAGERRFRAASRIGWTQIPAIVRQFDDRTVLTLALVENLQRADLNPVEEGEGYQRLMQEFGLTQQQVADAVGKDRSTVANLLRVLSLPAAVRQMLQQGHISLGHARALLALGHERVIVETAHEVAAKGMTVRDVERRARDRAPSAGRRRTPQTGSRTEQSGSQPAEVRRVQESIRHRFQTDVQIALVADDKGAIRIPFYSTEDFERVVELLLGSSPHAL
ncbi:MAG TPA: ParB/RepB/Spo0J family partition protein [Solirubrobacteraceae bacterium]|nr:ParB/RepB/Spo0J family partition protein [Solirubrobacteraceae bacterium]